MQHLMDDWLDVIVLLLLQFLNVFLGFFEELKARRRPPDAPRAPSHSPPRLAAPLRRSRTS